MAWAVAVGGVDDEGYGAVVDERYVHHLAEASGLNVRARRTEALDEAGEAVGCVVRGGGLGERRTASLPGVAVEGELTYDEEAATNVQH